MSYLGSTVLQIKRDINFSSTDLYHCICELGKWVCARGGEGWGGGGRALLIHRQLSVHIGNVQVWLCC